MVIYCVNFNKSSDLQFKITFLFSNGVLALSVWLFRNSLVLHKIDTLTSLAIHWFPFVCMYHFRWFTLYEDAKRPVSERIYVTPYIEETWGESFMNFMVAPVCAYLFWLLNYSLVNFKLGARNIEKN